MGRPLGFMPSALFRKITDEVAQYPGTLIKVVGLGEPALHPQINDLMRLIGERRIPSIVYTNGELFKACTAEQILGWDVQTIVVSVDGLDAESFARIRVGGDYIVLKGLLSDFHAARGQRRTPEIEVRHVIFPKESQADLLRFRQEWLAISDTVKFNYLYFPEHTTEEVRNTKCRDVRRELYIYWNGKVPLCGYQYLSGEQEWLGNVDTSSIAKLWNSARLCEVRRSHSASDLTELSFCKACTFK
jgi:MoaA/NifB/PqqE/SkfB family radical SAM enzyme